MSRFISDIKAQGITSVLITIMVAVVIGMVAIAAISPIISQTTEAQKVTNETIAFGLAAASKSVVNETFRFTLDLSELYWDDITPASEILTTTDGVTTYVRGTDYTIANATGDLTRIATGAMLNDTDYYASYSYTPSVEVLANDEVLPASEAIRTTDGATTYVRGTDYLIVNATGGLTRLGLGAMSNGVDYFASYQYWHDSYIASGIARSIVKLLPLMLALAVFLAVCAVGLKVTV